MQQELLRQFCIHIQTVMLLMVPATQAYWMNAYISLQCLEPHSSRRCFVWEHHKHTGYRVGIPILVNDCPSHMHALASALAFLHREQCSQTFPASEILSAELGNRGVPDLIYHRVATVLMQKSAECGPRHVY